MRTTLNLDSTLLQNAIRETGVQEKTRLIHMGLEALIREAAFERLSHLYGRVKHARVSKRRRFP